MMQKNIRINNRMEYNKYIYLWIYSNVGLISDEWMNDLARLFENCKSLRNVQTEKHKYQIMESNQ